MRAFKKFDFLNGTSSAYPPVHSQYCPLCKGWSHFRRARCGICNSFSRHRLIYLYLQQKTKLFSNPFLKMLDVAPNRMLEAKLFSELGGDGRYISVGKNTERRFVTWRSRRFMKEMDVQALDYPSETFDLCCCSHVLEHVENDRKSIAEIYRVCKECDGGRGGGTIMIMIGWELYSWFQCLQYLPPMRTLQSLIPRKGCVILTIKVT